MRNRWLSAAVALTLVVAGFVSAPALAQTTGDIEGTVTEQNGNALPGVAVEVKSPVLLGARSTVSDGAGRFRFAALPPGVYTLTATLTGFTRVERSNLRVALGATATIPVTMSVSRTEEVVVTGEVPVVDVKNTTIGVAAPLDSIQRLPLARSFTSIAATVPGTGTDQSGGNTFTVYGATGLENAYIIDGINATNAKTGTISKQLNNEFVQEVQVKTGGYEAEYGRVLGGTVNVITKSGGNEFHGDAFGYYDSESFAADDKRSAARQNVASGTFFSPTRYDLGFDLGGYILKDRLWFFSAYDRTSTDQDTERTLTQARAATAASPANTKQLIRGTDESRRHLYSGKLTFRLGESNTLAASILGDPGTFDGQVSTAPGPDSARRGTADVGSTDYTIKYDGIFGSQFLAQAQYAFHKDKNQQDSPARNSLYREMTQAGFIAEALPGSGPTILFDEEYKRSTLRAAGTMFAGAHEIKAGLDLEFLRSRFTEQYGGTDRLTLRLNASGSAVRNVQHRYFARTPIRNFCAQKVDNALPFSIQNCNGYQIAPTVNNEPDTDNYAFFAQDSWKVFKNLTLNAGIRYEQQKLKDFTGTTLIDVKDMWSPRIGLIWDPLNNGKSKVYANYGRFYQSIPQDIQTRALGDEYTIFVRNNSANSADPLVSNGFFPFAYVQGGEITQDGLKGMYQDELVGGVEFELLPNWAFGVKGIYRALGRVIEDRCDVAVNPDIAQFYNPNEAATCALVNLGEGNALGTIKDPTDRTCYPNGYLDSHGLPVAGAPCESTVARRFFRGVEFTATHRFSSNFYMLASYLYSQLQGNYSGNLSQTRETGQADPNINADFDYPGLVPNAYGLLRNDRKHQLKLSGYYAFPFGLVAGLNAFYTSGRPYSIRGCALDAFACGGGYSQEGYLVPRGKAGRLPATYEADLHLEYGLKIANVTITPILDVFNLLNRQGVTSREELFNNQGIVAGNSASYWENRPGNANAIATCTAAEVAKGFSPACSPNSNFGKDIAWQSPRVLRLGARVSF